MEKPGFRWKSPEELHEQEEFVALSRILTEDLPAPHDEEEFTKSLRAARRKVSPQEQPSDLAELREIAAEHLASSLEELVTSGTYLAEGNYGMVYQVDLDHLPSVQKNVLHHYGVKFEDAPSVGVTKILKVAHPGEAEEEHKRLKRAYALLQDAPDDGKQRAAVPNPLGFISQVKATGALQEALRGSSHSLKSPPENAEVIFMEYIEGKDLATRIYEFVLLQTGMTQAVIDQMSFNEKMAEAGARIGFRMPGGKGITEEARAFEEGVILRENRQKLITYLGKHKEAPGFPITHELLEAVRNTLDVFRENGFGHNDLHERNVMTTDNNEPFVVDFGRHSDDEASDDYALIRMYEKLLQEEEVSDVAEELRKREEQMLASERDTDKDAVRTALLTDNESSRYVHLAHQLQKLRGDTFAIIGKMVMTDAESKEQELFAKRLSLFFDQALRDTHIPLPVRRRLREMKESDYFKR